MKVNFEELKALIEAGDEKAFTQHIFNSFEKGDMSAAIATNASIKSELDSEKDKHHGTALETWKANNLESLVEEELKKRNPDKSPAELELEKLRKQFEDSEKARTREALKNKALEVASEKGLPKGVLDFFIADNEENTLANLSTLEQEVQAAIQAGVDAKFKANGRNPLGGSGGSKEKAGDFGKELAGASAAGEKQAEAEKHYFGE
ncbi:DUF4355 domain-containing protein [Mammaliicoccus sciuri]